MTTYSNYNIIYITQIIILFIIILFQILCNLQLIHTEKLVKYI